jgi:hypothetical protein
MLASFPTASSLGNPAHHGGAHLQNYFLSRSCGHHNSLILTPFTYPQLVTMPTELWPRDHNVHQILVVEFDPENAVGEIFIEPVEPAIAPI